jgi:hypothetical protein
MNRGGLARWGGFGELHHSKSARCPHSRGTSLRDIPLKMTQYDHSIGESRLNKDEGLNTDM